MTEMTEPMHRWHDAAALASFTPYEVDGCDHVVQGMRIASDARWVGTVELGEVSVTITATSSAPLALRRCTDVSIPEFPPDRHP